MATQDLQQVQQRALESVRLSATLHELAETKARFLGKTGSVTEFLKQLGKLPPGERAAFGALVNEVKQSIERALLERTLAIEAAKLDKKLAQEALDVSLPGRGYARGALHPATRTLERIEAIFQSVGFEVADGPEIETDFHNFTALNTPEDHPARSMHDTFYIRGEPHLLLRTHTSPIQVRYMQQHVERYRKMAGSDHPAMPEIKIIAPGRVYRVDSDATHSPMFHQVEGLWIGEEVSFADLKGVLTDFLRRFFEDERIRTRFRPSFFPFTEPSAEVDMSCVFCGGEGCRVCGHSGWLEIAGSGQVHPGVLRHCGIDSERYMGFAFGVGPDRLTMLRYGINDLRFFYDGDLRFLAQFA